MTSSLLLQITFDNSKLKVSDFFFYPLLCFCVKFYSVFIIVYHSLQVWKYSGTQNLAYGALEQIHVDVQTPEGQTQTDVLLTGGRNRSLRYR